MKNRSVSLLLLAILVTPLASADLPTLLSDDKGFVLSGLSLYAKQVRAESRKVTTLRLIGTDDQRYSDYRKLQKVRYGAGRFRKINTYTTPELKRALSKRAKLGRKVVPDFRLARDRVIMKYKFLDLRIIPILKGKNGLIDIFIPRSLYDSRQG